MLLAARTGDDGPELPRARRLRLGRAAARGPRRDGRRRRIHAHPRAGRRAAGRRPRRPRQRAVAAALRLAAGSAARQLAGTDRSRSRCPIDDADAAAAVLEGAALGAYAYPDYRSAAKTPVRADHAARRARRRRRRLERVRAVVAGVTRTRSREHPALRPLPRDARRARGRGRRAAGVDVEVLGRGGARGRRLRRHPRRRPRLDPRAAARRARLRARRRIRAPRARRQGHHLRLRRPLAQAAGARWSA